MEKKGGVNGKGRVGRPKRAERNALLAAGSVWMVFLLLGTVEGRGGISFSFIFCACSIFLHISLWAFCHGFAVRENFIFFGIS